ncbi:MAG: hypothetical protein HQL64_02240 [Magnetococcales bacterium]|nr:hypothetical protein [Magnetococcales bacterium]
MTPFWHHDFVREEEACVAGSVPPSDSPIENMTFHAGSRFRVRSCPWGSAVAAAPRQALHRSVGA